MIIRIKKVIFIIGYGFVIISLAGCFFIHHKARVDITAGVASLPAYSGPKASIAVADFDIKATKATGEIGSGLREILVTALINSNRFLVIERQAQAAVIQEQGISASGAAGAGNGEAQKGKNKTADLIITAVVTEFEPQASGGRDGVGGGGGAGSGVLGGLLGSALNKAHVVLNIRIVDTSTSEALVSRLVQGQASDVAGPIMSGFFGSWGLGTGLFAYANTPMEKAMRICIIEAVRYISQSVPVTYYKYNSDGKT